MLCVPGNTGNAGLSRETGATISRRRCIDQGCEGGEYPGMGNSRKDTAGEPEDTEAEATPRLRSAAASDGLPDPVSLPASPSPSFYCPILVSSVFRSHHITINTHWVCVTHPSQVLLDLEKPVPVSPRLHLHSQYLHHRLHQLQRTKSLQWTPHLRFPLPSHGGSPVDRFNTAEGRLGGQSFLHPLPDYAWEPRRWAFGTPMGLRLGEGRLNLFH